MNLTSEVSLISCTKLEGAQRVHISAMLHCLHPNRNFKFHLCLESRTANLYICYYHYDNTML